MSRVFVSPLRRCVETANLLYPGVPQTIIGSFRECDFGDFENKNYAELNGRADYQAWIDSGGELPFPHGESRAQFAARCATAFEQIRQQNEDWWRTAGRSWRLWKSSLCRRADILTFKSGMERGL